MNNIFLDSADLQDIAKLKPENITTNPSLIKISMQYRCYDELCANISTSIKSSKYNSYEILLYHWGSAILKLISGEIHLQLDPNIANNSCAMINQAQNIITLFSAQKNRIVIKIPATLAGIDAAGELEKNGIHCNMTLVFGLAQALLCAQQNVYMITPYISRIGDWYKYIENKKSYNIQNDPGLKLLQQIKNALTVIDSDTNIIAASIRTKEQACRASQFGCITINKTLFKNLGILNNKHLQQTDVVKTIKISSDKKSLQKIFLANRMAQENINIAIDKSIFCTRIINNTLKNRA